jgi:pre-mRNA-splicing helicase BRR2
MADNVNQKYSYHEMSNKVEMADRSLLRARAHEPTGEVETLRGRTDIGRMGDRVSEAIKSRPLELQEKVQRKKQKLEEPQKESVIHASGGQSILDYDNLTGYQPTTQRARIAYETILVSYYLYNVRASPPLSRFILHLHLVFFVKATLSSKGMLGSQATSVLRDAAEQVIATLKDGSLRDPERHDQISRDLTGKPASTRGTRSGGISTEQYATFVQLGKELDDYEDVSRKMAGGKGRDDGDDKVDEMGVAVVFDESDQEGGTDEAGDSDAEGGVVVDSSSESESDDEDKVAAGDKGDSGVEDEDEEEKLIHGDGTKKKAQHASERILSIHEIDAHFLQRQLSRHVEDANEAAHLAAEVLEVLDIRKETDIRECENKLILLLRVDLLDTIKMLLHNRIRIWACVSMKRAQTAEERTLVEEVVTQEPTGEGRRVWDEMHSKSRAEDWSRERLRGLTATLKTDQDAKDVSKALDSIQVKSDTDKMDLDDTLQVEEKVMELDLEQLAFREGSHTMSNKKCDLPDTSWRAMKKGYEEVHVPAIRSVIPKGEKLVNISELPEWTQKAFKNMEKLNRIQSKMYEVALKSSENLLLCAPTGAGKVGRSCLRFVMLFHIQLLHFILFPW